MTREEKIKRLKALKARCERLIVSSDRGPEEWRKDAEALDLALAALRGPTREMVERAWFREPYTRMETWEREDGATVYSAKNTCMSCGQETPIGNFCNNCGAALTDEAVDMMLKRWKEALGDET